MMRTNDCTPAITAGRESKAEEFFASAEAIDALGQGRDAAATLYIHAGIAAADVICCRVLGQHARGQNHGEAIELVSRADKQAARHLSALLKHKTRLGYGARPVSGADYTRVQRAATWLFEAMNAQ